MLNHALEMPEPLVPADPVRLPPILVLSSGGLEHGGGIGRMIGYMQGSWRRSPTRPPMTVVDTRGPGPKHLWPFYMSGAMLAIVRHLPDRPLLHVHVAARGSTWRKIVVVHFGRLLGLPIVLHVHEPGAYLDAYCRSIPRLLFRAARSMFHSADHVVVLGREAFDAVTGILEVPRDRVSILGNAVPAPAPYPPVPRPENAAPRILFLGMLSRRKGVHDLIEALADGDVRNLAWHATFAGGGPHVETFQRQAEAAGVADRIDFLGWVGEAETRDLLRTADILVLPSYAEGMPMAVLEAMSYGLCVITTPVGEIPDAIEDGVSGMLVPPGEPHSLSAALKRCLTDRAWRAKLGDGAYQTFLRQYDVETYPDRIAAIFQMVMARYQSGRNPTNPASSQTKNQSR